MFENIGDLRNYWHVIGMSSELNKGCSLNRKIYGVPLIIWRSNDSNIYALQDVCAHKKAPLELLDYSKNHVRCQYHGWEYNCKGELISIPSSKQLAPKMKCKVANYQVCEQDGLIWILLCDEIKEVDKNSIQTQIKGKGWSHGFASMVFETSEELLIENFMDATHTAVVHNKIIRSDDKKSIHEVEVSHTSEGVMVKYAPNKVKVGLGLNLMLGRNYEICHTDEFLCPNLVRVNYMFNQNHRFQAFISCTPLQEGKTLAFIRLSFKFGLFNPLLKVIMPYYTNKVLKQDFEITKSQYSNQQIFKSIKENHINCDNVYNKIKKIRRSKINRINSSDSKGVKKFEVNI